METGERGLSEGETTCDDVREFLAGVGLQNQEFSVTVGHTTNISALAG